MRRLTLFFITTLLLLGCRSATAEEAVVIATATLRPASPQPSATPTRRLATAAPDRAASAPSPTRPPTATLVPTQTPPPTPRLRRLTEGSCCTEAYWHNEAEIRFIDQEPETGQTGLWSLDISRDPPARAFVTDRLGVASPDDRYFAYPDRSTGLAVIEDAQTGESWSLDLHESPVNFSPDSRRILWIEIDQDVPFEERVPVYWLSNVDGSNRRRVATVPRSSTLAWLDSDTLLISQFEAEANRSRFGTQMATLSKLSLVDGAVTKLLRIERPRGLSLNPARTALVYYTAFADDPADNGLWYLDLTAIPLAPRKLPFLGAYRWQGNEALVYVPFDPEEESHLFYSLDLASGQSHPLTDAGQPQLKITNNDWSVSPDGSKILFLASWGEALDGLWLVELAP